MRVHLDAHVSPDDPFRAALRMPDQTQPKPSSVLS
jgi:hypothetical protein